MLVLLTAAVSTYAVVNVLGVIQAWRCSRSTALCFLAAASALAVAVARSDPSTLALGVIAASAASLRYGAVILERIRPWHHVIRAAIGVGLVASSLVIW